MKLLRWFCLFINIHWTTAVGNESLPDSTTDEEFEYINKTGLPTQLSNSSVFQFPSINQSSLVTRPGFGPSLWPNGVVPYIVSRTIPDYQKTRIQLAVKNYNDLTCLRFNEKSILDSPLPPFPIRFQKLSTTCGGSRCWRAPFGGGGFNVSDDCGSVAKIVQELGHILCMSDEETRQDRDKWIGYAGKCQAPPIDGPQYNRGLNKLYDYLSVTHSKKKCENGCILPKQPGVVVCGSSRGLSVLDIEIVNEVYNCTKGCHGYRFVNILNTDAFGDLVPIGNDFDGSPLYTCRAYHQGDIIPGKFKLATKECFVTWKGEEHKKTEDVEVLTNPHKVKLTFVANNGSPLANAVRGGRTNVGDTLYIIRCQYNLNGNMGLFPGKFQRPSGAYFGYDGTEIKCTTYEFLTCERA